MSEDRTALGMVEVLVAVEDMANGLAEATLDLRLQPGGLLGADRIAEDDASAVNRNTVFAPPLTL